MDVLVLGNGPLISNINFDLINPNLITIGVNRIWLKFVPNYLFFHDAEILYEIEKNPSIDFSNTILITTDWLKVPIDSIKSRFKKVIKIHRPRPFMFPDSVSTVIQLFQEEIFSNMSIRFYIAGVNLKWTNPSHFWKEDSNYESLNKHDESWYSVRFNKMLKNFQHLQKLGYTIVSVTPNSSLNKITKTASIEHLYVNPRLL